MPPTLPTARLDLVASTAAMLRAELEAPERLAEMLAAVVPEGWPPGEYDRDAIAFFLDRTEAGGPAVVGWYGWYAVRRAGGTEPATLVAGAGYHGPPDDEGTVEIGYSVVEAFRGLGYATEVVEALVTRATSTPGVRRVVSEAEGGNAASVAVLTKCGFQPIGEGRTPESLRFEWKGVASA